MDEGRKYNEPRRRTWNSGFDAKREIPLCHKEFHQVYVKNCLHENLLVKPPFKRSKFPNIFVYYSQIKTPTSFSKINEILADWLFAPSDAKKKQSF